MFSGIVEMVGVVKQLDKQNDVIHFSIETPIKLDDLEIGHSIAINGVCLTLTMLTQNQFTVTVVPETLRLTNLGDLLIGSPVNVERALKFNSRFGGHYVQGHIDGVGEIISLTSDGTAALIAKIALSPMLSKYLVNKGYITIDGMSITMIEASTQWFTVTFIPHTQAVTLVNQYRIGTKVNLEVDIFGKYVERMVSAQKLNLVETY